MCHNAFFFIIIHVCLLVCFHFEDFSSHLIIHQVNSIKNISVLFMKSIGKNMQIDILCDNLKLSQINSILIVSNKTQPLIRPPAISVHVFINFLIGKEQTLIILIQYFLIIGPLGRGNFTATTVCQTTSKCKLCLVSQKT